MAGFAVFGRFTLTIEVIQYITKLGVFDVDDIIMNTLGGIIGYCIYYVAAKLLRRYHARSKDFKVSAPGLPTDSIISYFLGGFGGLFVLISIIKSIATQERSRGCMEFLW